MQVLGGWKWAVFEIGTWFWDTGVREVTMGIISKVLNLSIAEYDDGDKEESIPGTLFTVVNNLEIRFFAFWDHGNGLTFSFWDQGEHVRKRYRNVSLIWSNFSLFSCRKILRYYHISGDYYVSHTA